MTQDRQDAYRDYFVALRAFSQSRFGVVADTSDLLITIEDRDGACGVIGSSVSHIRFGDGCMNESGLFGINSTILGETYFHLLWDSSGFETPDWTTAWMVEGSAIYFAYLWADHHESITYSGTRSAEISWLSEVGDPTPLSQTDPNTTPGVTALAFLAIDYMAEQTTATKPIDYFIDARNSPPAGFDQHFQSVFGISPDDFYRYFAAHRAAGFPQPGAPFGSPIHTPTPTYTPTASPTYPSGSTFGPTFVFPPNTPQVRQDAYRNYFVAMHEFSQSRFGVVADTSDLQIIIEDRDGACGVIGSSVSHIRLGDGCMNESGLFGITSLILGGTYFYILWDSPTKFETPDWTTAWMVEGSERYFAHLWADHHESITYSGRRSAEISWLSEVGDPTPLSQTDPNTTPGVAALAFLAIDYMAEQTTATKPIEYFIDARNSPPAGFAEHFQSVFGISPDTFYRYFAAHRAAGFPQPGAPFGPTPTPTHTPTYTPTATPVTGGDTQSRLTELERQTGMLQQLIQNLQALIQALTTRVDALDGGAPQPIHTPTPTATPSPTPTSVPGTNPTPVTTPVTDNACIQKVELDSLIAGTTIAGTWTTDCLTANPDPTGTYYAKFYTFTLDGREELEIRITSDETPYIFLMAGEGTDGEVIGRLAVDPGEQTQLLLDPGSYTLEVTTDQSNVTGDFDLWMRLRARAR